MNKIILILLALILFSSMVNSLTLEPFVSFTGEKVELTLEENAEVEMEYYYNLNSVKKCTKQICPIFKNNGLKAEGKKFELNTNNLEAGFYAIKITTEKDEYYTSLTIRPDYRLVLGIILVLLIALVIGIEKNVFRK